MDDTISALRREPYAAAVSWSGPPAAGTVAAVTVAAVTVAGTTVAVRGAPVGGEHGGAGPVPGRGGGGRH
ncbi:hypothetical protein QFZ75_001732 [Streptomyces sp. V3I8]|jgi:hypothetical protein|uniref:hypothetical protein n=1 Tax=Streptomyces sp. V3I8 TaxID=3042279 RepID=UPI0027859983|nr:hypothetical protein [Streptomyces sp. V3I8]MDQ1035316.1 hypothetical protein [Streptomyces sp. V3I8]